MRHAAKDTPCRRGSTLVGAVIVSALSAGIAVAGSPAWKPDKAVEIIVNTAPGSSPDKTARLMQKILQERRYIDIPATVVNKPGGGGAVAFAYINQHVGNGNYIAVASKSLLSSHIVGRSPITYSDVTPLVRLFDEFVGIAVKVDSPIKSGQDLIERLKKDPNAYSFGITQGLGSTNHQAMAAALNHAGLDPRKVKNVIFQSGGKAITALLGGHVDVVPASVGSWSSHLEGGKVRVIAVSAPRRLSGLFAAVPTWREQGYSVVISHWRSVIGPGGMTDAQISFWERAIQDLMNTAEWKKEIESIHGVGEFAGSAETRKSMAKDYAEIKSFLVDLGLAK